MKPSGGRSGNDRPPDSLANDKENEMSKTVSKKQARQVLKTLQERFPSLADGLTLYEPGFHSSGWTIACEGWGGEIPWTVLAADEQRLPDAVIEIPDGLMIEPVNHWCLGVYPA